MVITPESRLRPAVTLVALLAAGLGCWWGCAGDRAAAVARHATLADLLTGAAAVMLQVALAWLFVVTLLLVLEPRAGRELTALAGCPRAVRRALVTLCGVALSGAALVTPAQAHGDHAAARESSLDGLRLPDRMSGPEQPHPAATPHTVVVHPGDTLWAIAADHLPTGAAPAAVDHAWRSLYTANRAVIGPDPDLIHAGTELRLPPVLQPVSRPVTEEENR
jgi:hypothetical protein